MGFSYTNYSTAATFLTGTTTSVTGVLNVLPMGRFLATGSLPTLTDGQYHTVLLTNKAELKNAEQYAPLSEDNVNGVEWGHTKPIVVGTNSLAVDASTALEASSITKASSGRVYKVVFTNTNGAIRYFQFHNTTTVPADAAVPVFVMAVPASASVDINFAMGIYFSTGITWCNSTTAATKTTGSADSLAYVYYI